VGNRRQTSLYQLPSAVRSSRPFAPAPAGRLYHASLLLKLTVCKVQGITSCCVHDTTVSSEKRCLQKKTSNPTQKQFSRRKKKKLSC
jgi:hypothetical protein